MADPLYTRLRATAIRLIGKYGKPVTLRRDGAPSGPAHAPVLGPDEEFAGLLVEAENRIKVRANTTIQTGDRFGFISVELDPGTTAEQGDRIELDGDQLRLIVLEPLDPGGLLLLYEFQARR